MSWAAVSVTDSLSTMTTAETLPPPLSTGTSVGAPSRTRLLRENSTLKGVPTPVMRLAVSAPISAPGLGINEP